MFCVSCLELDNEILYKVILLICYLYALYAYYYNHIKYSERSEGKLLHVWSFIFL